ncbi:MAG: TRAP transporter small permease [Betaproteobacteria bacterium]|nr:TRAP transporter small permease [Betaproteobacteria bacterium]
MLGRIERGIDRLALLLALSAAAGLLVVALAIMLDVLLRWLFKAPIPGLGEISALFTAVVVAACFPMLIARRGNVTIRFVGSVLGVRTARLLDVFGALICALYFSAMTWQYLRFSIEMTGAGESTPILRWPVGPWWWVVTLMIAITTLITYVVFVREARGQVKDPDS